jgi:DNA-binding transcriptional ArsR family regulator
MVKYKSPPLDTIFSALADPTRRAILERLAQGEASVTELATPFDMSLPAVSKHVRVLENAGLVVRKIEGRIHFVSLRADPMREAVHWLNFYRQFWESQFDLLADYLNDDTGETDDDATL